MSTSSATVTQAADIRPPSGATAPTQAQRLAGTGVTEAASATALTGGARSAAPRSASAPWRPRIS